jgi:uncharacterized protein YndB with AHSA1/START domain
MTTDRQDYALRLARDIAARCERVFAAFVDPEQFRDWWGPAGFTVPSLDLEAVEGRDYRVAMQPPDGELFHLRGTFREVEEPRRLVFTFAWEEPDPDDQETVVTLLFEPAAAGTRIVLAQGPFRTEARLELHRQGWSETLDRLERSLAS